jgi:hypothetical protein
VLVNEINALGVKDITDLNINRKILQSLRKPDYDMVKAIIYEKKLEELKPSHILSKIMAHELQIMPKSKKAPHKKLREPSSPTTSHALSSQLLTRNLHLTPSTQQAEQASFTREKIPRRASQFFLKIDKR